MPHIFSVLLLICTLAGFSVETSAANAGATTNQLILQYKENTGRQDNASLRIQSLKPQSLLLNLKTPDGRPLVFKRRLGENAMVVSLPKEMLLEDVQILANSLAEQNPDIAYGEPDRRFYPVFVPNDPAYLTGYQWNLYENFGINAQDAWDTTTGNPAVVIAVLDTGILPHGDLNPGRILPGYDFIADASKDADSQPGRDNDPRDPGDAELAGECGEGEPASNSSWHGLTVTGVIVAESDNSQGMAGIDFFAGLLPVRVLGKCGGSTSDIIDAMRWAAGLPVDGVADNPYPANVLNLSFSGEGECSKYVQAAINDVGNTGAVVVVAAGNDSESTALQQPASCANVITVGATTRSGTRAPYVSNGSEIDLSAPGGDDAPTIFDKIYTLYNTGTTAPGSDDRVFIAGTSFSTAQVSATASLMLAVNDTLTGCDITEILRQTSQPFLAGACDTQNCGTGILDTAAAVAAALDPVSVLPDGPVPCDLPEIDLSESDGGGCSLNTSSRFDASWLLMLIAAMLYRSKCQRQTVVRHRTGGNRV